MSKRPPGPGYPVLGSIDKTGWWGKEWNSSRRGGAEASLEPTVFPEAQLEHIWRGELLLFLLPGSGADGPFSLPASFECREFRRRWEPRPGWELSYSWRRLGMCNSAEKGRASLSPDLGGKPPVTGGCTCEGEHRTQLLGSPQTQSRSCG